MNNIYKIIENTALQLDAHIDGANRKETSPSYTSDTATGQDILHAIPEDEAREPASFYEGKLLSLESMEPDADFIVGEFIEADNEVADMSWGDDAMEEIVKEGLRGYDDGAGTLLNGIQRLGHLGTDYWGRNAEQVEWYKGTAAHQGKHSETNPGPGLNPNPVPDPEPVILNGLFKLSLVMHEDGQPFKYKPSDPDDPHCPSDGSLEDGHDPETGMPLAFTLEPSSGSTAEDVLYLHCFTPTSLPDPSQGTVYYNGVPLELGVTINVPDMNGFTFVPSPHFSGAVAMEFTYVLCTDRTGPASDTRQGEAILVVDSVADLASASAEATGETTKGNDRETGEAVIDNGWAAQEAAADDTLLVTFTVTAQFYDLDGSETAWIDISLPPGFSIPEGSGMELVENENGRFARIHMPDLTTLKDSDGEITVPVALKVDNTADTGSKSLSVSVYTYETDGLDTGGFKTDNNLAVRTIDQSIEVDLLPGDFTAQAGWAYEGGKNGGSATEDVTEIGLDQNSTTDAGAPLVFSLQNGSFTGGTITIDPALGTLYHDGTALVPDENGLYTLSAAQLNNGRLTFAPSGHTDGDVPVRYSLEASMDNGSSFTFSGNTTVVVDAVADAATVDTIASQADAEDSTAMTLTVNAAFPDVDGSESHYILVECIPGWNCPDAHELVTVYFDGDGNPMQPTGYLPDGSGYAYEGAAFSKTYFRFDVTEENLETNGSGREYTVRLTPPDGAGDTELGILTMAEEKAESLAGREYDVANNVAWTSDTANLDLADATATITATPAYENHNPDQHMGATGQSETDGVITVALENNGDTINAAEGQQIVLTFTYDGPGDPGSFTCGITGETYTLDGSANYTLIPGTDNQYRITIDLGPEVMDPGETSFTLRYNPPLDDDTDLTGLSVSVPIVSGSGHTGTTETGLDRLVVDAVANKPESLAVDPAYEDGYTAAASGGNVDVTVNARFGDYQDGSEQHYLVFDLDSGFASIDLSSFPEGSVVLLTPAEAAAAGLPYADGGRYVVVQVSNEYLREHGGVFNATIKAGLDEVEEDTALDVTFLAVSKDTPTDAGEVTTDNNLAVEESTGTVQVNTVTSKLTLHADMAYENGTSHAHLGDGTVNGAGAISVSGLDEGEILTSLTISWPAGSGSILYEGQAIEPGDTIIGDTTVRYDPDSGTITLSSTGENSCVSGDAGKLAFLPAENNSDVDVSLDYSGTIVDTGSGLAQDFTAEDPATVVVDAVAQKPTDVDGSVTYQDGQTAASDTLTITATATFRDTEDGSETHYLLIQTKNYLDMAGLLTQYGGDRVLVGYDNDGNPLTPAPGGMSWLNPDGDADSRDFPARTEGFVRIPVDEIIREYDTAGEATQTLGDFTVTRNPDGSFTVSLTADIAIIPDAVTGDITDDPLLVGGMAEEKATVTGGDGSGGEEGHNYNNVGYDFAEITVNVSTDGGDPEPAHYDFAARAVLMYADSSNDRLLFQILERTVDSEGNEIWRPMVLEPGTDLSAILTLTDEKGYLDLDSIQVDADGMVSIAVKPEAIAQATGGGKDPLETVLTIEMDGYSYGMQVIVYGTGDRYSYDTKDFESPEDGLIFGEWVTGKHSLNGDGTVITGDGDDFIYMDRVLGTEASGNVNIFTGDGNDVIIAKNGAIANGSHINMGEGDNQFLIYGNATNDLDVLMGDGNNSIEVNGGNIGGTFTLGNGDNTFNVDGSVVSNSVITTGNGDNSLSIAGNLLGRVDMGNGDNSVFLGGNLEAGSHINTGSGNDTIYVGGTIYGNVDAGAGDDLVIMTSNSPGWSWWGVSVNGGDGMDTLNLDGWKGGLDLSALVPPSTSMSDGINGFEVLDLGAVDGSGAGTDNLLNINVGLKNMNIDTLLDGSLLSSVDDLLSGLLTGNASAVLRVNGDSGDKVTLGSMWEAYDSGTVVTYDNITYSVYFNNNAGFDTELLLIQQGLL